MPEDDRPWWEPYKVDLPVGQRGRWAIERFTVASGDHLQPYFSVYGQDCPPGDYTRLVRYRDGPPEMDQTLGAAVGLGGVPVMTDTPGEIEDHLLAMEEIQRRGGRVLIHGLGLGMILRFALAQPNVSHVDVVELDQDVIDLVAHHYQDERLTLHHGDALSYVWPVGSHWDVVWHDIWDSVLPSNLPQMTFLHRRFARRCGWQGSWSKDHALAKRRLTRAR